MKKMNFKYKVYILLAIIGGFSLIADIFDILELNRYNALVVILLLTILFCVIQYRAAMKGLDTMFSIGRDYKVRKIWGVENLFDWEKVRERQLRWAPVCTGISLMELFILYVSKHQYIVILMIIWAINLLLYVILTRPLKY
ncbi:TPA: hypothetical protein U1C42_002146 [Streptococcus suis]|uniref:hypothetical protein n=1 Tax=Streptococcus parasuis TaxID=1501662 RepID=UPI002378ED78|nr:hypothetical protein [Streptococcus parasuis]HEM3651522.1 hypothetical protein [Streptococcus suis]WDN58824.1 hypothetical protein LOD77_01835 [Streptococcus parasuis]WDN60673.1 hypothetical protein LOD78_01835 [Streptococcus parasuis]HEM3651745.1 hypothetical protein [Streptococcus suis]HEM3658455.1 hypothetical protein [Streptococcus suis]